MNLQRLIDTTVKSQSLSTRYFMSQTATRYWLLLVQRRDGGLFAANARTITETYDNKQHGETIVRLPLTMLSDQSAHAGSLSWLVAALG